MKAPTAKTEEPNFDMRTISYLNIIYNNNIITKLTSNDSGYKVL